MKRALPAVAVLVVVLATLLVTVLVWNATRSTTPQLDRHADDVSNDPFDLDVAHESAPNVEFERSPVVDVEHPRRELGAAPNGERFADIVRPVDDATGALLEDALVYVCRSSGERRTATLGEAVRALDVDEDGAWIVDAPGHCASWIDGCGVALALAEKLAPIELALAPSGTLRVDFDDELVRGHPIDSLSIDVRAPEASALTRLGPKFGYALHTLTSLAPSSTEVASALPPLRAGWMRTVAQSGGTTRRDLARALANGATRRIGSDAAHWIVVPGPIDGDVELELLARTPHIAQITGDGTWSFRFPWSPPDLADVRRGGFQSERFTIAAGELFVLAPRHLALARVTARTPADATDVVVHLDHIERTEDSSSQRTCEAEREGDVFEWGALHPGRYELEATWTDADHQRVHVFVALQLAPGEKCDLGTLDVVPGHQLTIVPRVVGPSGEPLGPNDFDPTLVVVTASATRRTGSTDGMGAEFETRSFEFAHGEPVRLLGLVPGRYTIDTEQVLEAPQRKRAVLEGGDIVDWGAPPNVDDVHIVRAGSEVEIDVQSVTTIDYDVRLERLRELQLEVEAFPSIAGDFIVLQAWIADRHGLRGDGPQTLLVTHDSGSRIKVPWRLALPSGEWSLFLTADPSPGDAAHADASAPSLMLVARCDVHVGTKRSKAQVTLVAAATLSVDPSFRKTRLGMPGFDDFEPPLTRTTASDGRHIFKGLVPDTEFQLGEKRVRTGPPGSTKVVE